MRSQLKNKRGKFFLPQRDLNHGPLEPKASVLTNDLIHLCFSACGPGTAGAGRPAIKCPAVSTWVDGYNTSIPDSQGTILQQLQAAGLA